jgi:RimJ/RimL family protein N-acetyltransferase
VTSIVPAGEALAVAGQYLRALAYQDVLGESFRFELLGPEHTEAILRWRNDAAVIGSFRTASGLTREAHERFLADYTTRDRVDLVLVDTLCGAPVGVFYLTGLCSGRSEIGKYIGEARYRGKGLAKLATRALIAFAFDWLGLGELFAVTRVDNERNILLNEALGFRRCATETHGGREFLVMTLTRTQDA